MVNGSDFVNEAKKFLGDPYIYGAAGPSAFDCSGLVQYSLEQLGVQNVPRTSEAQYSWAIPIQQSQLQPGDLIFEQWPGDSDAPPGHVVIYAGNNQVVEAPQPGQPVHLRSWSPDETQIVGYGTPPGVNAGVSSNVSTASLTSFNPADPGSWVPSLLSPLTGSLERGINDILERGALIVFGAVLVMVGIWRMASSKQQTVLKNQVNPADIDSNTVSEEPDDAVRSGNAAREQSRLRAASGDTAAFDRAALEAAVV